jgi:hypothetical protein
MKNEKPKLLPELSEVNDFMLTQEAKTNETEIEEVHIEAACLVGEDLAGIGIVRLLHRNTPSILI